MVENSTGSIAVGMCTSRTPATVLGGPKCAVESCHVLKHWRGLATSYDKTAIVYRGGVILAAIYTWPRT